MFSTLILKQTNFSALRVSVWRQTRQLAVVSVGVLGLVSCGVSPIGDGDAGASSPEARREAVAARSSARWAALIKGDYQSAYQYLSPASRLTLSYESYQKVARKTSYREAKIDTIECDAAACKVKLYITYDHRLMKGITTPLDETWIFDKGQAWYVYRD